MNGVLVSTPDESVTISVGSMPPLVITSPDETVLLDAGGMPGEQGPPGPPGPSGTMVVAVPFNEWPPADPQPNTLYLRLTP